METAIELPENLDGESWYKLMDATDKNRDTGWAPQDGIQNLLDDGWGFIDEESRGLYESTIEGLI